MTRFSRLIDLILLLVCLQQGSTKKILANGQNCLPAEYCAFLDCCCYGSIAYITCKSNNSDVFPTRNSQITSDLNIGSLEISGYTFDELPSQAFEGLDIQTLILRNNMNFNKIKADSFAGVLRLFQLNMENQNVIIVEPHAFEPIKNVTLMTLTNDVTIDSVLLNSEFPKLSILTLQELRKPKFRWFFNLPDLTILEMNYNPNIEYPQPDGFFISNPKLDSIRLSNNNITDLAPVLNWLRNTKNQLKTLYLYFNNIQVIPIEMNLFTELTLLDFWSNSIQSITSETFRGLTKLERLDLSANKISDSPRDAFRHNSRLETLIFGYNQFKQIHDFPQTIRSAQYSNQSGQLTELRDFQFDIAMPPDTSYFPGLFVYLDGNNLITIGNKLFCSQTDSSTLVPIASLRIDYSSLTHMNLCLFRQMGLRNDKNKYSTSLSAVYYLPEGGDLSEFCNCEFILFLDKYNIMFSMLFCDLSAGKCRESNNSSVYLEYANKKDQECAAMEEFECIRLLATTTTTPDNFALSNIQLNMKLLIGCLFLAIFTYHSIILNL